MSREDTEEIFLTLIGLAVLSGIVAALVLLTILIGERRAEMVFVGVWFVFMCWCGWKGFKEISR
jgi:hypothetical protein